MDSTSCPASGKQDITDIDLVISALSQRTATNEPPKLVDIKLHAEFESYDQFMKSLEAYQNQQFVLFRTYESRFIKPIDGAATKGKNPRSQFKYQQLTLKCKHYGLPNVTEALTQRLNQKSYRIDCKAGIRVRLNDDKSKLVIIELLENHNHECNPSIYYSYPEVRRLNATEVKQVEQLVSDGWKITEITRHMRNVTKKNIARKDIENLKFLRLKKRTTKTSPVKYTLRLVAEMDEVLNSTICKDNLEHIEEVPYASFKNNESDLVQLAHSKNQQTDIIPFRTDVQLNVVFRSFAEFVASLEAYQKLHYVLFKKFDGRLLDPATRTVHPEIKYKFLEYRCTHYGAGQTKQQPRRGRGGRPSVKLGCPARIQLRSSEDNNSLIIAKLEDAHNHECSKSIYLSYPQIRRLNTAEVDRVFRLLDAHYNVAQILQYMRNTTEKMVMRRDIDILKAKYIAGKTPEECSKKEDVLLKREKEANMKLRGDSEADFTGKIQRRSYMADLPDDEEEEQEERESVYNNKGGIIPIKLHARFSSYAQFVSSLNAYQQTHNVLFTMQDTDRPKSASRKVDPKLKYRYIYMTCKHFGKPTSQKHLAKRVNQRSYRLGCEACIRLLLNKARTRLVITQLVDTHNHECSRDIYMSYPEVRRLNAAEMRKVEALFAAGYSLYHITCHMRDLTGKLIRGKDILNMQNSVKKSRRDKVRREIMQQSLADDEMNIAAEELCRLGDYYSMDVDMDVDVAETEAEVEDGSAAGAIKDDYEQYKPVVVEPMGASVAGVGTGPYTAIATTASAPTEALTVGQGFARYEDLVDAVHRYEEDKWVRYAIERREAGDRVDALIAEDINVRTTSYKYVKFTCQHGMPASFYQSMRRRVGSTECPSHIWVHQAAARLWVVTNMNDEHNHDIDRKAFKRHGRLDTEDVYKKMRKIDAELQMTKAGTGSLPASPSKCGGIDFSERESQSVNASLLQTLFGSATYSEWQQVKCKREYEGDDQFLNWWKMRETGNQDTS